MSKRSNRLLSSLDTNSELEEILNSESTRPSLGFLGLETPGEGTDSPARPNGSPKTDRNANGHRQAPQRTPDVPTREVAPLASQQQQETRSTPAESHFDDSRTAAPVVAVEDAPVEQPARTNSIPAPTRVLSTPRNQNELMEDDEPGYGLPDEPLPAKQGKRLYRCARAQDGHSHLEQEIYAILWKHGQPEGDTDNHICSIGYSTLSFQGRVHRRNLGAILTRLGKKLAIEVISPHQTREQVTKTYRVFSYSEILKRRKAAGLEWIIRGRGVEFVDPETRVPLFSDKENRPQRRITTPGAVIAGGADRALGNRSLTATGPGDVTSTGGHADTASPPDAVTALQIESTTRNLEKVKQINKTTTSKTSSSFPGFEDVVKIMNLGGFTDTEAAVQLVAECQAIVSDAAASEICEFISEKLAIVQRTKTIHNPIGFLLTTVPKCFVGESFQQLRAEKKRRLDAQLKEEQERQDAFEATVRGAVELVTDEDSTEEFKQTVEKDFRADPYRRLRDFLSEEERASVNELWTLFYTQLSRLMVRQTAEMWFKPLKAFKYRKGVLTVIAPRHQFVDHIEDKYAKELATAVQRVCEESTKFNDFAEVRLRAGFEYFI